MTGRTEPGPHLGAFRAGNWPVDAADMEGRKIQAAFSLAGTTGSTNTVGGADFV